MTDYFGAGKMSLKKEVEQGKMIMDVCKAAGRGLHSLTSELNLMTFGNIAHVRAQLKHPRDTSTHNLKYMGGKFRFS